MNRWNIIYALLPIQILYVQCVMCILLSQFVCSFCSVDYREILNLLLRRYYSCFYGIENNNNALLFETCAFLLLFNSSKKFIYLYVFVRLSFFFCGTLWAIGDEMSDWKFVDITKLYNEICITRNSSFHFNHFAGIEYFVYLSQNGERQQTAIFLFFFFFFFIYSIMYKYIHIRNIFVKSQLLLWLKYENKALELSSNIIFRLI